METKVKGDKRSKEKCKLRTIPVNIINSVKEGVLVSSLTYLERDGLLVENSGCISLLLKQDSQYIHELEQVHEIVAMFSSVVDAIDSSAFMSKFNLSYRVYHSSMVDRTIEIQGKIYTSHDFPNIEVVSPNVEDSDGTFLVNIFLDGNYGELLDKMDFKELLEVPNALSNNSLANYIRKYNNNVIQ